MKSEVKFEDEKYKDDTEGYAAFVAAYGAKSEVQI